MEQVNKSTHHSSKRGRTPNNLEKSLSLLILNTEEPFIIVDTELNILIFNHQFEEQYFTHFRKKIIKGASILDYAQKEKTETLKKIYNQIFAGETYRSELEIVLPGEEKITLLLSYKPAYDEKGEIMGAMVSSTDISEKKRAQQLLIASENRFRSLINNANDIISLTDKEGKIIDISPALEKVTGFTPEEMKGKVIFSMMHPDQSKEAREVLLEVLRKPGVPIPRLNRFLNKKGDYVWVEGTVTNLLEDDNVRAIVANYHDITNRKEVEEKLRQNENQLRAILDNQPECVKVVDLSGTVLEMNPAGLKMLEAQTLDQVKGNKVIDLIHPDDYAVYREIHGKACSGEPAAGNFRVISLKQNLIWMETNSVPLRNSAGEIYAVLSVTRDVTEIKKSQEEAETNEKRYRALVEKGEDVMAILSPEGKPKYVSPSIEKVLGYTEKEALNLDIFSSIHPEDINYVQKVLEETMITAGKSITGRPVRALHKDGSWQWFDYTVTNMIENPAIQGLVSNFRNVTAKVLAEQEKEFDHNNLHALINNTNDLMWSISREGKLITSNRAFDEMVKFMSGNDVIKGGDAPTAGFSEEQLKKWEQLYAKAFSGETFTIVEYTDAPEELWSEISFYPIHRGGEIIGTACYSRNITERKLFERRLEKHTYELIQIKKELEGSEKSLKEAQEMAHLGSWEADFDTFRATWSDETYRIFGVNKHEFNPSFEAYLSFIHPEDRDRVKETIEAGNKSLKEYSFKHRIITKDGIVKHIYSNCRFSLSPAGKPFRLQGILHDITESVEAQKSIRAAKERYDVVAKATSDIIWDWDIVKNITHYNHGIYELLGYKEAEVPASSGWWDTLLHPEDKERALMAEQEFLDGDSINLKSEYRLRCADGSYKYILDRSIAIRNKKGKALRMIGAMQDITERKNAERKLQYSESRLKQAQALAHIGNWEVNFAANISIWSDEAYRIYGLEPGEHGLSFEQWKEFIHPEDLEGFVKEMQRAQKTFDDSSYHHRITRKDGTVRYVISDSRYEFNSEGKPIGLYGTVLDVTEKKLANEETRIAKERYDLVAKATNDAIYDWDLKTNTIVRPGDGLKILFGIETTETMNNSDFWKSRVHPEDADSCYLKLQEHFRDTSKKICDMEYRFLKADGRYAYVYDKGYIVRNEKGEALRVIGATQDITHRKETEILLKELNERLEKRAGELAISNKELEQFAYIASHDLQEPLRMVTSFLTQLENKYRNQLDDKAQKYIHFATDGAIRMRRIILDLLEYSRVGRQNNDKEVVDLNEILFEAVQLNRAVIEEKNALVRWKDLPTLKGSKTALQQIFQNLIGNALKYQKQGEKPIIKIKATETETHWQFSICDNGIGIEPQYFDKIFVVFQRLHNKDEYSGTGIGLAICKKIVENHQGKMWVESNYGSGSTFYFTISKNL